MLFSMLSAITFTFTTTTNSKRLVWLHDGDVSGVLFVLCMSIDFLLIDSEYDFCSHLMNKFYLINLRYIVFFFAIYKNELYR